MHSWSRHHCLASLVGIIVDIIAARFTAGVVLHNVTSSMFAYYAKWKPNVFVYIPLYPLFTLFVYRTLQTGCSLHHPVSTLISSICVAPDAKLPLGYHYIWPGGFVNICIWPKIHKAIPGRSAALYPLQAAINLLSDGCWPLCHCSPKLQPKLLVP